MSPKWSFLILACLLVSLPPVVRADSDSNQKNAREYWSIQLENDFFANSGDRYYTNGLQVSRQIMDKPPAWLGKIASIFPAYKSDGSIVGTSYTVGQQIFTPDDTQSVELVVDDRPYAGYLYFSTSLLARVKHKPNHDTGNLLEFTIGIVGPASLAEQSQTWFHELLGNDVPKGWDNQLGNELGLGISYSRFWRNIKPLSGSFGFGMSPQLTAALGNVNTYAAAGVMFRLGTHLNRDLSPPNIKPGFPGFAYFAVDKSFSWYVFGGVESRLVLRNIFLDGNSFSNSHSVDKEHLIGDLQFGAVFHVHKFRISISNMLRTKEFTTQTNPTNYGAINISFAI